MGILGNIGHVWRLSHVGWVLAREGVFAAIDPDILPSLAQPGLKLVKLLARKHSTGHLATAIARLGPSYVKLGQFLATRPDIAGMRLANELTALQDKMAPFPQEVAIRTIEAAFGQPLSAVFVEFGPPIAAASIAQVHRAKVLDNGVLRDVAVKVARPHVEARFRRDLADMYFAARLAAHYLPDADRLQPVEVVDTLARSVRIEMDFRLEAAAASEFGENIADDTELRVPSVDWQRTARDVLTLEWVEAISLSDRAALQASGLDLPKLGQSLIQSFLRHAVRDGFFHADMHQGNLMVDADGKLVAVDFGIMGRLGLKERRFLAEILFGFIMRDYRRVAEVHFEAGYVPSSYSVDDFAQAIRAIGEPIHSKTADQISMAKLLTLLFEITALFEMKTRTELVMLQKTMVVVEGVARTLDPHLNMWKTAEPVMRDWIERNLGPLGKLGDAGAGVVSFAKMAAALPEWMNRAEQALSSIERGAEQGFSLSPRSIENIGKAEARRARWGNAALWVIAALLAWHLLH